MDIVSRQVELQKELDSSQIDVTCVLKPHNVTYLAGYAPVCSAFVAFPDFDPVFCTLWLDASEAKKLCTISEITGYVFPRETMTGKLIQIVKNKKPHPKKIGVEKDFLSLRDYELLHGAFPSAEFVHITPAIDRLRAIKSDDEIAKIQRAAAISDKAMAAALETVRPGVTELDIAAEAEYVMKKMGSERTAFSTFVASGNRTLLAHPVASRREVERGEPVVIDLGASWDGYAADICRSTFAGKPTPEQVAYLRTIVQAQKEAAAVIKEGAVCNAVYDTVYKVFQAKGLGKYLPDDIGYGVGLRQSEFYPVIEKNSHTVLKENMVVALLQTTAYSKKVGGLRVEDTFKVTKTGCEKLNIHTQDLFD